MIFGTRPEAIKMAPIAMQIRKEEFFELKICITGQHREMLKELLELFELPVEYNLDVMEENQSLSKLTAKILLRLDLVLEQYVPDIILVHGDTTTSFVAALAAFYHKIKIGHIEAGLRSHDPWSPFPEELNRTLTGNLATYHFAPTKVAKQNLLQQNIGSEQIKVTGNTVIDALNWMKSKLDTSKELQEQIKTSLLHLGFPYFEDKELVLITGHRRENFGKNFQNIINSIKILADEHDNKQFVYPVHLNPNIKKPVYKSLSNRKNIFLLPPLNYPLFIFLMINAKLILTDSGGIQEEATALTVPVLVMRENTERPEALSSGACTLVGTNTKSIVSEANLFLTNKKQLNKEVQCSSPFGNGQASEKIIKFLMKVV